MGRGSLLIQYGDASSYFRAETTSFGTKESVLYKIVLEVSFDKGSTV